MKISKRLTTVFLTVIMLVCLFPAVSASAASSSKLIALTFDDGPSSATTPRLLDGLKKRGAHVSFFVLGQNAANNKSLIKREYEEGHQVCSHTYDHSMLTSLSDSQIKSQASKTKKVLDSAIGYSFKYQVRPPYGDYNSRVLKALNTPCYYWSVDTRDWESLNATSAYNQFISAARNGSIVLMHDIYNTTVTAALNAIDTLQAEGYEFVTLNELLVRRGITPTDGKIVFGAYPGSFGTGKAISKPTISFKDTDDGRKVVITGDKRGNVYYTTNGEEPNPNNSKKYTAAFSVKDGVTVKAKSVIYWNGFKSDTVSLTVKYPTLTTPKIAVNNGSISFSGLPKCAAYYYTTNGNTPTKSSTKYTAPFAAAPDTVYTVKGYATGYNASGTAWITYSAYGNVYTDVKPGSWYYQDTDRAIAEGILDCVNKHLAPDMEVTRCQLVSMLYTMAGKPSADGLMHAFVDTPADGTYLDALAWAYSNGITNGCGEGKFKPYEKVTREQACAMLTRFIALQGADLSKAEPGMLDGFTDKDDVEPCIADCVNAMCSFGIVKGYGDGTLLPRAAVTRAEIATMLMRIEDLLSAM